MATPVGDSYGCDPGSVIAAGRYRIPSWVRNQAIGTWGTVPASNTISSLNPKNNPAINPVYPASPEWNGIGIRGLIDGYSGGTVDYQTAEFWLWGGGHADYGGNEPYKLNLWADTPAWQMMRPPSGAIGNPITDGGPTGGANNALVLAGCASGLYSDGRPRPTHSYNSLVYVPGKGMTVTNMYYCWPNLGGPSKLYAFSESTNDWTQLGDYTALGTANSADGGCCYDVNRNCIWVLGSGVYSMIKIDCATGAATLHGIANNHAQKAILKYDTVADLVYILSASSSVGWLDYPSRMSVFDPTTDLFHALPSPTGALAAGMSITGNAIGWDQASGRMYLWNDQTNRAKISVLTKPAGNILTSAWVASELQLDAGNTVTPTAPMSQGTYGRFDYIDRLGGCVLINAVDQPVYFYRVK